MGGVNARLEDSKYMVSIRLRNGDKGKNFGEGHFCGGTLIERNKILTAAHCIYKWVVLLMQINYKYIINLSSKKSKRFRKASDYRVVMGTLNKYQKTNETLVYKVSKITVPESYQPNGFKNDVAVMFIKESVPEKYRYIVPIPMNNVELKLGTLCSVTGWGSLAAAVSFTSLQ